MPDVVKCHDREGACVHPGRAKGMEQSISREMDFLNMYGRHPAERIGNAFEDIDALTSRCDADSLRLFVHEIARTIQEENRERFLLALEDFSDIAEPNPTRIPKDDNLEKRVDDILLTLSGIQNGDRELEAECNETWDDWSDEEEEYEFSDPDGLLDDIESAFAAMHECLDKEEYGKGLELARALSCLEVKISGECLDFDDAFDIADLIDNDLLPINLEQCVCEAVCLAYMAGEKKAEDMLAIMKGFDCYSFSLEDILRIAPKEMNLEKLLPEWIEALAKCPAKDTDKLLVEAQNMLQDDGQALKYASRYAASHPALYLNILQWEKPDRTELMKIGLKAIKEVPLDNPTRSKIALLTARYAFAAHDDQTREMCWLEAFRTSPSVANYLRLRLLAQNWDTEREKIRTIYEACYSAKYAWEQKPLASLMFFDERFEEMQNRFMAAREGIGWSSTFMKEGMALLLMLLNKGGAQGPGMKAMISKATDGCSFDREEYCMGMDACEEVETEGLFKDCFEQWKENVTVDALECDTWIKRLEHWIALRVSAIMAANRRNYYWECAAYIAAFGEMLQSRGTADAKETVMQQYRREYPRRRAFHEELRRYGMKSQ